MKPFVFKKEIHFRLIRRIAVVCLLAFLFGSSAFLWLEYQRLHDWMLNNAKRESGLFTAIMLQDTTSSDTIPPAVRDQLMRQAFQQTDFIKVEITTPEHQSVFSEEREDGAARARQFSDSTSDTTPSPPETARLHFVDQLFFLQFTMPLQDPQSRQNIGSIRALSRLRLADLKEQARVVASGIGVIAASIFLCGLFLYPGILLLQHRIITGSGAASRANGFLLRSLATALSSLEKKASGHHHARLAIYAIRLAENQHLPRIVTRGLAQAALLHNLEQLTLAEPQHLTESRSSRQHKQLVTTHQRFMKKLKRQHWFNEAEPIIRSLHERYDGSGYPSGLQGEAIPIGARILALVDYFDSATVPGSAQDPHDLDSALRALERESATRFDPVLVAAFIAIAPRIFRRLVEADEALLDSMFEETVRSYLPY